MGFWPPLRGEGHNQLERFAFTGMTSANTDRGRGYVSVTATTVDIYSDYERTLLVASGSHSQPTTWTKVTLATANTSGLSGSCYLKYVALTSIVEVFIILATDDDLAAERIDINRYPKTGGTPTTFAIQHVKIREDFVRIMLSRIPPVLAGRGSLAPGFASGSLRGSYSAPWRINSIGDFELVRLQNVESYGEWAIHATLAVIFRTVNRLIPNEDTQLRMVEEEAALASAAWAETIPLFDDDDDLDADRQSKRFRVSRG